MADEIKWITVNGVHIPIKPGQTKDEAVKEFTEKQAEKDRLNEKSVEELKEAAIVFDDEQNDIPQIILPSKEYGFVMSELATNLTKEEYEAGYTERSIRNYKYYVIIRGFNNYRIIGRFPIRRRKRGK